MKINKNIFITGAAGMIGSDLINKYIPKNYNIYAYDDLSLGKIKFIKKFLKKKNFYFKKIDLSKNNFHFLKKIKKKNFFFDEIWLLAANSDIKKSVDNFSIDFQKTFLTTYYTLENLKKFFSSKTKIIFSSSSAVFGVTKGKINEQTILNPINNYGKMKALCEQYLESLSKNNKIKLYIFRFPNVVGKNLTHGILYDFIKKSKYKSKIFQVLGNGKQQKPYSYSEELIDCMIYISNKIQLKKNFNIFNIGSDDKGISVRDIVELFKKKIKLNKIVKYQKKINGWPGDIPQYRYSTKKINKLGFKFKMNSRESIIKSLEYIDTKI